MESRASKADLVQMQKRPMWPPGASCIRTAQTSPGHIKAQTTCQSTLISVELYADAISVNVRQGTLYIQYHITGHVQGSDRSERYDCFIILFLMNYAFQHHSPVCSFNGTRRERTDAHPTTLVTQQNDEHDHGSKRSPPAED